MSPSSPTVTIYSDGAVFTGNRRRPWVQACAVLGSKILGVGTTSEVRHDHPGASEHDLDGGTLLPGLIDAHNHFLSTGESLGSLESAVPGRGLGRVPPPGDPRCRRAHARERCDQRGRLRRREVRAADPRRARLRGREPSLDLFHTSGHNVLVNTLVFAEAGVDEAADDPPGGRFVRDGDGRLSGLCLDAACGLVLPTAVDIGSHGPNFHTRAPMEALVAGVDRASRAYLAAGLTALPTRRSPPASSPSIVRHAPVGSSVCARSACRFPTNSTHTEASVSLARSATANSRSGI